MYRNGILVFLLIILNFIKSYNCSSLITNHLNNRITNNIEEQNETSSKTVYRLPRTIAPEYYVLKIVPFFENKNFLFEGEVTILLKINEDTNEIVLNSVNLNFNESTVNVKKYETNTLNQTCVNVSSVLIQNNTEQVIITTEEILKSEQFYSVEIKYNGRLTENNIGFYRTWYSVDNIVRWAGATQMEGPNARWAFPCFDEPHFRAIFDIKIARHKDIKTVSNMPVAVTTIPDPEVGDRVWDWYESTPPMPTYLVAFCIFDFKSVKNGNITIWIQPKYEDDLTDYVLNITQEVLDLMGNFTSIQYTLPKMELVAVPDFDAGAMENWGLTTYREKYILYKPKISTESDKQSVLSTIAHEMSHQWFGNLVTLEWWDYLWLNEGFATFFEYYIPSLMEPEWRTMDQFVVDKLQAALSRDDGSGHPVNANVSNSDEIENNFDIFAYSKAGSLIRMMNYFTGEDNFRNCIQHYLENGVNQSHGVVNPKKLWDAFDKNLPEDVLPNGVKMEEIMSTWFDQDEYPVITVTRNYENQTMTVSQNEFIVQKNDSSKQWWVPLTYTCKEENNFDFTQKTIWLKPNTSIEIKLKTKSWVLFNVQQIGYYRVNYDNENWNLVIDQLMKNHTMVHPINRAQIIDDSFALAESGIISYDVPITISRYLVKERDYIPWYSAIRIFNNIIKELYFTSVGQLLKAFVQNLVRPVYKSLMKIPFESRTHVDNLSMSLIIQFACNIRLNDCEKDMISVFNNWLLKISSYNLVPEIKEAVLCTGLKLGTEQSWNDVWAYYKQSEVPSEQSLILQTLSCASDANVLSKFMDKLKAPLEPPLDIRQHDYIDVFYSIATRPDNSGITVKYLINNYKALQNANKKRNLVKILFDYLGSTVVNEDVYNEFNEFYLNNKEQLGDLNKAINGSLRQIRKRLDWANTNAGKIEHCLSAHTLTEPSTISTASTTTTTTTTSSTSTVNTTTVKSIELTESSELTGVSEFGSSDKPNPSSSSVNSINNLYVIIVTILIGLRFIE